VERTPEPSKRFGHAPPFGPIAAVDFVCRIFFAHAQISVFRPVGRASTFSPWKNSCAGNAPRVTATADVKWPRSECNSSAPGPRSRCENVKVDSRLFHAALSVLTALLMVVGSTTVRAGTEPTPVLRVASNTSGEIEIEARRVTIEQVLGAIAAEAGFEVTVAPPGIPRAPVNMTVPSAPVESVLRQILRGRNYALVYDGDDAFLSQVVVLPPPAPGVALPWRARAGARNR